MEAGLTLKPFSIFSASRLAVIFFICWGWTSLYPISIYYLFQIDGGINFFNQEEEKVIDKYRLDNLNNTIAPVINLRTGVVWDRHWLTLLGYGFVRREDYDFPLNYLALDQKIYEQRDIHNAHFQAGYYLFPYQSSFNISFETGIGWALYRALMSSIDNYSKTASDLREIGDKRLFQVHQFYLSPAIKFYRNLRRGLGLGGDIYIGFQYSMLFPSKINFPEIILGFDASIDYSYTGKTEKKTFAPKKEVEKISPEEGKVDQSTNQISTNSSGSQVNPASPPRDDGSEIEDGEPNQFTNQTQTNSSKPQVNPALLPQNDNSEIESGEPNQDKTEIDSDTQATPPPQDDPPGENTGEPDQDKNNTETDSSATQVDPPPIPANDDSKTDGESPDEGEQ